jgi:hypothetical protein
MQLKDAADAGDWIGELKPATAIAAAIDLSGMVIGEAPSANSVGLNFVV